MRTTRTTAIAGALVFIGLSAPRAMAAEPLSILDLPNGICIGDYCKIPRKSIDGRAVSGDVILPEKIFRAYREESPLSEGKLNEAVDKFEKK